MTGVAVSSGMASARGGLAVRAPTAGLPLYASSRRNFAGRRRAAAAATLAPQRPGTFAPLHSAAGFATPPSTAAAKGTGRLVYQPFTSRPTYLSLPGLT
jgi:hypothetical protein